ncbi:hypothetical protein GCM10009541_51820 [Micromonospora gifhornensis]|uniref:Uncharacterized protein n=1 Tax=Micromonospora gifhornensis TaxID=84594 RepID=A0ABQ4I7N1_9ACTN|nr:hypothetical protein Vgi01_05990 [Micromonospora gifhornensis]
MLKPRCTLPTPNAPRAARSEATRSQIEHDLSVKCRQERGCDRRGAPRLARAARLEWRGTFECRAHAARNAEATALWTLERTPTHLRQLREDIRSPGYGAARKQARGPGRWRAGTEARAR